MKKRIVRGERNSDGINKWLLEKAIAPPKSGAGWRGYSSLSKLLLSDGGIFTKHDQSVCRGRTAGLPGPRVQTTVHLCSELN